MSSAGLVQILAYLAAITALPLGRYMAWVFAPQPTRRRWPERAFLRVVGSDGTTQGWKQYVWSLALLSLVSVGALFLMLPIVAVLALGMSLAAKTTSLQSAGSLRTDSPTFAVSLVAVIVIMSGLTILPALALGPIAEALSH